MKHLLLLFVLIAFSCKKEDENPESKTARLEIEWITQNSSMNIWYNIGSDYAQSGLKGNSFKLDTIVQGGQFCKASLSKIGGSWNTLLVKFNSDTLFYETDMESIGTPDLTLPFIH